MDLTMHKAGKKRSAKLQVSDTVFAARYNEPLIHQVLTAYLAASRSGTKAQKTRSDVNVPLRELFDNPTIAQIAGIIGKNEEQREKFEQILQEIEGLSDDQVRALLG